MLFARNPATEKPIPLDGRAPVYRLEEDPGGERRGPTAVATGAGCRADPR